MLRDQVKYLIMHSDKLITLEMPPEPWINRKRENVCVEERNIAMRDSQIERADTVCMAPLTHTSVFRSTSSSKENTGCELFSICACDDCSDRRSELVNGKGEVGKMTMKLLTSWGCLLTSISQMSWREAGYLTKSRWPVAA